MKIYRVKVNGKEYEVELESVSESTPTKSVPKQTPPQQQNVAPAQGVEIKAPMQGNILEVKMNVGDHVNKGQVLFVLEAMKLENDIVSSITGTVKQILVSKNQAVNNQDILAIIE